MFDLDGTIINNNEKLDPYLENCFYDLICKGHTIIFSTARSVRGVKYVLPKWCLDNLIIYCNGSFAEKKGELIYSEPINSSLVLKILENIDNLDIPYYLEMGHNYYHTESLYHDFYKQLKCESPNERIFNKKELIDKPIYKVTLLEHKKSFNSFDIIQDDRDELHIYEHFDGAIDVVSKKCTKWNALSNIIHNEMQIGDVISFGNDINDYELLKNSHYSIAVNPQNEKLKLIANQIIPSFDVHAIGKILMNLAEC